MTAHPLTRLDPPRRIIDRAQNEPFSFALNEDDVLVRNEGYDHPNAHEYRVRIEDGLPTSCSCPADSQYPGACKHRVAIAIRPRILDTIADIRERNGRLTNPRSDE